MMLVKPGGFQLPLQLWLPLSFFALLWLRGPVLAVQQRENVQAMRTLSICTGTKAMVDSGDEAPWFSAVQARCMDDAPGEEEAWQQVLRESDTRLHVIMVAQPHNVELADMAASRYPENARAHFWLGGAWREEGNLTEAIHAYETGLQLESTAALVWDYVGLLYRETGQMEKAVHAFDQACYYVDRGKNGCLQAGDLYLEWGMYEEAADRYRTSLEQLPGYAPARRGLIEALLALDRPEKALPHLQALADQGDANARVTLEQLERKTD